MAEGSDPRGFAPAEAFKLLGHDTRIDILLTLWEADDAPLGFSELYRRAEVADSGQFNYHLDKLLGRFVGGTDSGYELTNAGSQVVQSVVAGTAIADPTLPPTGVDESCPACDAPVQVQYTGGILTVTCTDCAGFWRDPDHPPGMIGMLTFPPVALRDRSPQEALDAGVVFLVGRAETMMKGVCPHCAGRVEPSLDLCASHDEEDDVCDTCGNPFIGVFTLRCATCKERAHAPSFAAVHHHPIVEALYAETVSETPWAWMWRGIDWSEEVVNHDPPQVHTTVEHAGHHRVFEVDADCTVTVIE